MTGRPSCAGTNGGTGVPGRMDATSSPTCAAAALAPAEAMVSSLVRRLWRMATGKMPATITKPMPRMMMANSSSTNENPVADGPPAARAARRGRRAGGRT